MDSFVKGWMVGSSLIMAIGAQNAFVLKQGLMKNQLFTTALFCFLVDAVLIALGAFGLGSIFNANASLLMIAKWGGALFLFWYGYQTFSAISKHKKLQVEDVYQITKPSLKETLWILAALSLLNPHVYLDTVVLLGSIGAQFESPERPFFVFGAMFASLTWFFALSYGASFLSPLFRKPKTWKILDGAIGCIMWTIAISLIC